MPVIKLRLEGSGPAKSELISIAATKSFAASLEEICKKLGVTNVDPTTQQDAFSVWELPAADADDSAVWKNVDITQPVGNIGIRSGAHYLVKVNAPGFSTNSNRSDSSSKPAVSSPATAGGSSSANATSNTNSTSSSTSGSSSSPVPLATSGSSSSILVTTPPPSGASTSSTPGPRSTTPQSATPTSQTPRHSFTTSRDSFISDVSSSSCQDGGDDLAEEFPEGGSQSNNSASGGSATPEIHTRSQRKQRSFQRIATFVSNARKTAIRSTSTLKDESYPKGDADDAMDDAYFGARRCRAASSFRVNMSMASLKFNSAGALDGEVETPSATEPRILGVVRDSTGLAAMFIATTTYELVYVMPVFQTVSVDVMSDARFRLNVDFESFVVEAPMKARFSIEKALKLVVDYVSNIESPEEQVQWKVATNEWLVGLVPFRVLLGCGSKKSGSKRSVVDRALSSSLTPPLSKRSLRRVLTSSPQSRDHALSIISKKQVLSARDIEVLELLVMYPCESAPELYSAILALIVESHPKLAENYAVVDRALATYYGKASLPDRYSFSLHTPTSSSQSGSFASATTAASSGLLIVQVFDDDEEEGIEVSQPLGDSLAPMAETIWREAVFFQDQWEHYASSSKHASPMIRQLRQLWDGVKKEHGLKATCPQVHYDRSSNNLVLMSRSLAPLPSTASTSVTRAVPTVEPLHAGVYHGVMNFRVAFDGEIEVLVSQDLPTMIPLVQVDDSDTIIIHLQTQEMKDPVSESNGTLVPVPLPVLESIALGSLYRPLFAAWVKQFIASPSMDLEKKIYPLRLFTRALYPGTAQEEALLDKARDVLLEDMVHDRKISWDSISQRLEIVEKQALYASHSHEGSAHASGTQTPAEVDGLTAEEVEVLEANLTLRDFGRREKFYVPTISDETEFMVREVVESALVIAVDERDLQDMESLVDGLIERIESAEIAAESEKQQMDRAVYGEIPLESLRNKDMLIEPDRPVDTMLLSFSAHVQSEGERMQAWLARAYQLREYVERSVALVELASSLRQQKGKEKKKDSRSTSQDKSDARSASIRATPADAEQRSMSSKPSSRVSRSQQDTVSDAHKKERRKEVVRAISIRKVREEQLNSSLVRNGSPARAKSATPLKRAIGSSISNLKKMNDLYRSVRPHPYADSTTSSPSPSTPTLSSIGNMDSPSSSSSPSLPRERYITLATHKIPLSLALMRSLTLARVPASARGVAFSRPIAVAAPPNVTAIVAKYMATPIGSSALATIISSLKLRGYQDLVQISDVSRDLQLGLLYLVSSFLSAQTVTALAEQLADSFLMAMPVQEYRELHEHEEVLALPYVHQAIDALWYARYMSEFAPLYERTLPSFDNHKDHWARVYAETRVGLMLKAGTSHNGGEEEMYLWSTSFRGIVQHVDLSDSLYVDDSVVQSCVDVLGGDLRSIDLRRTNVSADLVAQLEQRGIQVLQ